MIEWLQQTFGNALSPQSIVQDRILFAFWVSVAYVLKKVRDRLTKPTQKRIATFVLGAFIVFLAASVVAGISGGGGSGATRIRSELRSYALGPNKETGELHASIFLNIVNSGAPSVLWRWTALLRIPTGEKYTGYSTDAPQSGALMSSDHRVLMHLDPTNQLPAVLLTRPLFTGEGMLGWTDFVFPVRRADLPIGSTIEVFCFDSRGKKLSVTKITVGADVRKW